MKISIIGAGNVGSLTAMRLAQENLGSILLVDIIKGIAQGKSFDLDDARYILKGNYKIEGTDDISKIKDSGIVIITAGLPRKPGMTREDLLQKNTAILKDVCAKIKSLAKQAIIIVVTNPLDLMTYFALKNTSFERNRIIGMGASLDASRFANLIANELNVPVDKIDAMVIGSHGEGMIPLANFTTINNVPLSNFLGQEAINSLIKRTVLRGAEIVSLLGNSSAYFAPSAAILSIVKAIVKNEKRIIGACAYLDGEYGLKDTCIGVPCRIGSSGIENIVELELNKEEKDLFFKSAEAIRDLIKNLPQ